MLEAEVSTKRWKLNSTTTVTIKSTKKADRVWSNKIIVEHDHGTTEPLRFESKGGIAKLIEGFELEDDQLGMDFGSENGN